MKHTADDRWLEVRYRYQKKDGTPMWIAFDPERPCIYCEQPVASLSAGGPLVCGSCDCGNHRDGKKWTAQEAFSVLYPRANRKIEELPFDPAWEHYEASYKSREPAKATP